MRQNSIKTYLVLLSMFAFSVNAQIVFEPPYPEPDSRFKSDILLVVAHPDDETAIGSFLAKLVFDLNKRISVVYTNRGSGGGNSLGNEQSTAMGLIRETEVRTALANFKIFNVWFLDGLDTPGQDVFHSLKNLNHGAALEKLVRIIRLARPEIVITWLPLYSSGENHGDHQAAGIIATEAFALAGDPTLYPTQLASPRESADINNYNEGLRTWQPKKIYFFSDREKSIVANGPEFDIKEVSTSQRKPYYKISTSLMKPHAVQADVSEIARVADKTGDYSRLIKWLSKFNLIFGKSLVDCSSNGDIFEGIEDGEIDYVSQQISLKNKSRGIYFEFGGVFSFYEKFWEKHRIEHLKDLVKPEVAVAAGSIMHIPLKIINNSDEEAIISIKLNKPEGWEEWSGSGFYKVGPGKTYEKEAFISVPFNLEGISKELSWSAKSDNRIVNELVLKVDFHEWVLPQ